MLRAFSPSSSHRLLWTCEGSAPKGRDMEKLINKRSVIPGALLLKQEVNNQYKKVFTFTHNLTLFWGSCCYSNSISLFPAFVCGRLQIKDNRESKLQRIQWPLLTSRCRRAKQRRWATSLGSLKGGSVPDPTDGSSGDLWRRTKDSTRRETCQDETGWCGRWEWHRWLMWFDVRFGRERRCEKIWEISRLSPSLPDSLQVMAGLYPWLVLAAAMLGLLLLEPQECACNALLFQWRLEAIAIRVCSALHFQCC